MLSGTVSAGAGLVAFSATVLSSAVELIKLSVVLAGFSIGSTMLYFSEQLAVVVSSLSAECSGSAAVVVLSLDGGLLVVIVSTSSIVCAMVEVVGHRFWEVLSPSSG